jgi:hypothetical protein
MVMYEEETILLSLLLFGEAPITFPHYLQCTLDLRAGHSWPLHQLLAGCLSTLPFRPVPVPSHWSVSYAWDVLVSWAVYHDG